MLCRHCTKEAEAVCSDCDLKYCGEACFLVDHPQDLCNAKFKTPAFFKSKGENGPKSAYLYLYQKYSQIGGSALDMTTVMRQHAARMTADLLGLENVTRAQLEDDAIVFSQAFAALFLPTEADLREKFSFPDGEIKKKKQLMRVQQSAIANHFLKERDMVDKISSTGKFNKTDQTIIFGSAVELWTALGASESAAIEDSSKASTYRVAYLESVFEVWKRYNLALAQAALLKYSKNLDGAYEQALTALVEAHTAGTTIGTLLRGPKLDVSQLKPIQKTTLASAFSPTILDPEE